MLARSLTSIMGRHSAPAMLNKWLSFDYFVELAVNPAARSRLREPPLEAREILSLVIDDVGDAPASFILSTASSTTRQGVPPETTTSIKRVGASAVPSILS